MPLNTVYQVRARQLWNTGGKPQENVYFYNHTAGDGDAAALATAWGASIGALVNAIQDNIMKNYSIDVINLGNLSDFASVPWLGTGEIDGDVLPPFAAVGYTMKVNTRAVRKGSKRYSGIPEAVQGSGIITNSTYLADMELLRIALQQEIVSADDTWLPVVVKRVKEAVAGTTPTQYTYRLPTTDGELTLGEVVVVLTSPNISHQVSREV